MNWRLRFVSFFICSAFAVLAFWYYRYYISPRPNGVIVFIVPALTPELITNYKLVQNLNTSFIVDHATDFTVVDNTALYPLGLDTASIMSFFSTGVAGPANELGLDENNNRLDNLLYRAQRAGRLAGIISTESVISIHLAAFYAHTKKAWDKEDLSRQLIDAGSLNTIMGGGSADLNQYTAEAPRDLLKEADLNGFDLVRDNTQLEDTGVWIWRNTLKTRKLLGLFSAGPLPYVDPSLIDNTNKEGEIPTLKSMVRNSIQFLQYNLNGYFLVVHHGKIEQASRENNYPQLLQEIRELDRAMAEARSYAGPNTLILLYSPYSVQGLGIITKGEAPSGSKGILPQTRRVNGEKIPVLLEYPGPFRPEMEFNPGNGWASVYYYKPTYLKSFVTPNGLNELLTSEF